MITVIIPTLKKCDMDKFNLTLEQLSKCKFVDRVIVHDNTKENLYVNPVWNMGVRQSEAEFYLLLNDDVVLVGSVLEHAVKCFNETDYDVLFIDTCKLDVEDYFFAVPRNPEVKVIPCVNMPSGCFIMGRKSKWIDIPEDLKIFFGDNWIYDNQKCGKILSTYVSHAEATTVHKENAYNNYLEKERIIYQNLVKKDI